MVKVADVIMGGGKSSAAITYINEHPEKKFIYITPYLDEAERIKLACPGANFTEPSNKIAEYRFAKSRHTAALIHDGLNIASTHQAFLQYTPQMLEEIAEYGYELIIDESLGCTGEYKIHQRDFQLLADSGLIETGGETWSLTAAGEGYDGEKFAELTQILRSRSMIRVDDAIQGKVAFYWLIPPELLKAFCSVFILTYLFDGQELRYYLDANQIPYERIGVAHDADGAYRFSDTPCAPPAYTRELGRLIHIEEHDKLNQIGESRHALSMSWVKRSPDGVEQLRRNTYNYFRNLHGEVQAERKLWGAFDCAKAKLRGKGYTNAYLPFNARATNAYSGRDCLAYLVNVFPNVTQKLIYEQNGIQIDDDTYALSCMIQWIWRSAIRNGKEITLYVPSKRMRELLLAWVASFKDGDSR